MRRRSDAKGLSSDSKVEPLKEELSKDASNVVDSGKILPPNEVQKTKPIAEENWAERDELVLAMGAEQIVRTIFDVPDVFEEHRELRKALKFETRATALSLGQLIDEVESASDRAQRASEMLAVVRAAHDDFEARAQIHLAAMHERAVQTLLDEADERKKDGKATKRANKDDVAAMTAQLFPDEWADIQARRSRAKHAIETCKSLADQWVERQRDLRAVLARFKGE